MKLKFNKSKVGDLPAFAIEMPEPRLVVNAMNEEQLEWLVGGALRGINSATGFGGIKLYDESLNVWSVEKTLSIISQGMAISNSQTFTEADFASVWAKDLRELTLATVDADKLEAAKAILAKAVRHGGKAQLTGAECKAIVARFSDATNDHEVFAIAVANAKQRIDEIRKSDALADALANL
jgi:hypothetical protein